MCEHTRYLSMLWEPAWNTLVFLLRQAVRAACGRWSLGNSRLLYLFGEQVSAAGGGSGRQGRLVCMEMERPRRYGLDTGASWVKPTPSCYRFVDAHSFCKEEKSASGASDVLGHTCNLRTQEGKAGGFN